MITQTDSLYVCCAGRGLFSRGYLTIHLCYHTHWTLFFNRWLMHSPAYTYSPSQHFHFCWYMCYIYVKIRCNQATKVFKRNIFHQIFWVISRINWPKLGMFVLVLSHFSFWIQNVMMQHIKKGNFVGEFKFEFCI